MSLLELKASLPVDANYGIATVEDRTYHTCSYTSDILVPGYLGIPTPAFYFSSMHPSEIYAAQDVLDNIMRKGYDPGTKTTVLK